MKFGGKFSIYSGMVIFLSIIGFILRITNLSAPSLWVDEYIHINKAKDYIDGLSSIYVAGSDNNGVLLTYIITLFFKIFSSEPFWARFPSVLFGTGSIVLVYLLGKRLFNRYIGLIAAFLNTFSLYLIYWSRLTRNYSIFEFFFLLLIIVLFNVFEPKEIKSKLKVFNVELKSLLFFLLVLVLSYLSHQLTFFVFFGGAVYLGINGIRTFLLKKIDPNKEKYYYVGIPSFVLMLLIFIPFSSNVLKYFLSIMLPEKAVEWVVPNWNRLTILFKEQPYESFNLYKDVFLYDFKILLIIFSIGGLVIGLLKQFKSTFYILSFLIIPFILMSFIFREPALPRYIIFLVPLAHILIGVFFYYSYSIISEKLSFLNLRRVLIVSAIMPFLVILSQCRFSEIYTLIKADNKLGFIVDKRLSQWSFSNYSYPCNFVLHNLKPHDLIFSTHKESADYYLKRRDVIFFRQYQFNTIEKKYELFGTDFTQVYSARSLINIQALYQYFPRGWLIADYYFNNVMTDPNVKTWVFKHMNYHPSATLDGTVMVFSWDKSVPIPAYQGFVEDIGKSDAKLASATYLIQIKKSAQKKMFTLNVMAKNIDSYGEAQIYLNEKHIIIIPKNTTNNVELLKIEVDESKLIDGDNFIEFIYNIKTANDVNKGFLLYNLFVN